MILRPGECEEVQRLFIARTALRQRDAGWGEEPGVSASQPAFQAAMREQVGLRNGAREDQGIMERECVAQRAAALNNAVCSAAVRFRHTTSRSLTR